jgi:hypothetical protein
MSVTGRYVSKMFAYDLSEVHVASTIEPSFEIQDVEQSSEGDHTLKTIELPLLGIKIYATIKDYVSSVTIEQHYSNNTEKTLNTFFQFPLQRGSAVCGFEATIDGRKIVGKIEEKQKAKEIFEEAKEEGKSSYLLSKTNDHDNVFELELGNLASGKTTIVKITYITELESDEMNTAIHFSLPALIEGVSEINTDLDKFVCTRATSFVPNDQPKLEFGKEFTGVQLQVVMEMPSAIQSVEILNNSIAENALQYIISGNKGTIDVSVPDFVWFTSDLKMNIVIEELHKTRMWVEKGTKGSYAAMIVANPKREEFVMLKDQITNDFVFLLDRSGSMSGDPIEIAKQTLLNCVELLPSSATFNIIGFGSTYVSLFNTSQVVSPENIDTAKKHINSIAADLGGTNLLDPLTDIYQQYVPKHVARQIFVISDGCVEYRTECVELAKRHANNTRIFSFGIGSGVDKKLINELAGAGHGKSEFLQENQTKHLQDRITMQLKRALQPAYTSVQLTWGDRQVPLQSPFILPPLFCEEKYIIYAIFPEREIDDLMESQKLHLSASSAVSIFNAFFEFVPYEVDIDSDIIHRLAAKSLIAELEDGELRKHLGEEQSDQKATQLAIYNGLVCKTTSFVAVDETVVIPINDNENETENVYIPLPQFQTIRAQMHTFGDCKVGGSGLGIFARYPDLSLGTLMNCGTTCFIQPIDKNNKRETPFGFDSVALPTQIGHFTHVFKGPLNDIDGHNCWLNALLPLLMTIRPFVDHINTTEYPKDTFGYDLSLLFKFWQTADQESENFRTKFNFLYNRVWFHLQSMGFRFGDDQDFVSAIRSVLIMSRCTNLDIVNTVAQVEGSKANYVILLNISNNNVCDTVQGYYLKSAAVFHMFTTSTNKKIGHFSCICPQENGFYYYDDILNFGIPEYKGGFVIGLSPEEFLAECPVAVFAKRGIYENRYIYNIIEGEVEDLIERVATSQAVITDQEIYYVPHIKNKLELDLCVDLLRRIRFACYFEDMPIERIFKNLSDKPLNKSSFKMRHLARDELKLISESPKANYGLYLVCKFGILNSVFELPKNVTCGNINLLLTLHNMSDKSSAISKLACLLEPFKDIKYKVKGRNSRKKIEKSVILHFLKNCLLVSSSESDLIMQQVHKL